MDLIVSYIETVLENYGFNCKLHKFHLIQYRTTLMQL